MSGFTNATPFGESWEKFKEHVEPRPEAVLEGEAARSTTTPTAGILRVADAVAADEGGEEGGRRGRGGARRRVRLRRRPPRAPLLLPGRQPRRVQVVEGRAVARHRRRRPARRAGSSASPSTPSADRRLVGLTERSRPARAGYTSWPTSTTWTPCTRASSSGPSPTPSPGPANWVNQHIIDGVVNGAGVAGRTARRLASTATSTSASSTAPSTARAPWPTGTGSALRPVQSGKVNQYGALLFGAAAVGAVVLVIVNV